MSDEWGPWIEHDGSGCPCLGMYVHVEYSDGSEEFAIAGSNGGQSWFSSSRSLKIIRYRIRKPRGMQILQQLVENPPKELVHT